MACSRSAAQRSGAGLNDLSYSATSSKPAVEGYIAQGAESAVSGGVMRGLRVLALARIPVGLGLLPEGGRVAYLLLSMVWRKLLVLAELRVSGYGTTAP